MGSLHTMEHHTHKKRKTTETGNNMMYLKTHVKQKKAATGKFTASIPFTLKEPGNRKAHLCGQNQGEEW